MSRPQSRVASAVAVHLVSVLYNSADNLFLDSLLAQDMPLDFAPDCCLGIGRHVLQQMGLLDESFFVYWKDTDFCLRLKSLGIPIMYLPEPRLLHDGGAPPGGESSPAYLRLYYRSYMRLLRKHFGRPNTNRRMLRLLLRENSRPNHDDRMLRTMVRAMPVGLGAPLVAQTRL